MPATATNGTVDIDTLPPMMMSRVDIVTGGASAVYGSDAVTGVVNFILDKKFDGLKMSAQGGISSRGDDGSYKVGIAGGMDLFGGRGHVEFSYEHYNSDGLDDMNKRRRWGRWSILNRALASVVANPYHLAVNSRLAGYTPGGYITSSNPALNDHFFQGNGVLAPFTHGLATGSAGDESGGDGGYAGQGVPGSGADPWLLASLRTDQLFARFDYDLSDNVHAYVQASGAQAYNFNSFFTQWFSANIQSGNPYLPASVQAVMAPGETFNISKTIQDAPGYSSRALTTNFDTTIGLNGTLFDRFNWDLHYTHGQSRLHGSRPRQYQPAAPVCRAGCRAAQFRRPDRVPGFDHLFRQPVSGVHPLRIRSAPRPRPRAPSIISTTTPTFSKPTPWTMLRAASAAICSTPGPVPSAAR